MQKVNHHYKDLFLPPPGVRYFVLMGGRSAGRSTAGSQLIKTKLFNKLEYFRCAMMRFVYGDIKNLYLQDTLDRIEEDESDMLDDYDVHGSPLGFSYKKNKVTGIGFRKSSSDQKSKLKSLSNYNVVVIEEADEVAEDDFMQLDDSLRTLKSDIMVVLMLNPPEKNHWIIKRFFNLVDVPEVKGFYKAVKKPELTDTVVISTTYLENIVNVNPSSIVNFERYKETRPEYYWNMIRGYVSEGARGRIFTNWKTISDAEFDALPYPTTYGLDFGFSCLVGETLVQTNKGQKHLENIKVGDMVLTRKGYRAVTNKVSQGYKKVYGVDFGYKHSIIATGDHRIFTEDGWKMVSQLSNNETVCIQKKSLSTEQYTDDTLKVNTPTTSFQPMIKRRAYTGIFIIATKELSRKAFMYITSMAIRLITYLKTLLHYLQAIIPNCITKKGHLAYRSYLGRSLKRCGQSTATQARTGENAEPKEWRQLLRELRRVLSADRVLRQLTSIKSFVVRYVERWLTQDKAKKNTFVRVVEFILRRQPIIQETHVLENVPIYSVLLKEQREVFDITVEGEREFFANGILVHNCDPAALLACKTHNNKVWFKELLYEVGLTNVGSHSLSKRFEDLGLTGQDLIYGDSAEMKSIEELCQDGWFVEPAVKGPGSVNAGIDLLQGLEVFYTESSTNIDTERQNYKWRLDRNKLPTGNPEDKWNHLMDAGRYVVVSGRSQSFVGFAG